MECANMRHEKKPHLEAVQTDMPNTPLLHPPVVDIGPCILCEVCVEVAPHAFAINDAGFVEVLPLEAYSDEDIHEAIKNCPKDCITRE